MTRVWIVIAAWLLLFGSVVSAQWVEQTSPTKERSAV